MFTQHKYSNLDMNSMHRGDPTETDGCGCAMIIALVFSTGSHFYYLSEYLHNAPKGMALLDEANILTNIGRVQKKAMKLSTPTKMRTKIRCLNNRSHALTYQVSVHWRRPIFFQLRTPAGILGSIGCVTGVFTFTNWA